jgi:sn-glycerol 3-phosphate transport system ATP-binding protein
MRLEIKSLQQRLGTTSLFVTHDQIEAMTLADRMVVMNEGVTEQIGSPLDVYQKPETVFAAQFIGSPAMNIIKAVADKQRLKLENGSALKCMTQSNGDVLVGMRPEDLIPDKKGEIVMDVKLLEPIGASTLVHGTLKNSDTKIVSVVQGLLTPKETHPEMSFSISREAIHLFSQDTSKRILN